MSENYRTDVDGEKMGMIRKAWPELNIVWSCDVGDYQGTIYVIGYVGGKVLACGLGYGSCSGCGAWGDFYEPDTHGGEPMEPKDFIDSGVFGKSLAETLAWADDQTVDSYQSLSKSDREELKGEVRRAFSLVQEASAS